LSSTYSSSTPASVTFGVSTIGGKLPSLNTAEKPSFSCCAYPYTPAVMLFLFHTVEIVACKPA
jgi:hypothetical protein